MNKNILIAILLCFFVAINCTLNKVMAYTSTLNIVYANELLNTTTTGPTNAEEALEVLKKNFEEFEKYLKALDEGYVKGINLTDEYLTIYIWNGQNYYRAKIEDIDTVITDKDLGCVTLKCKGNTRCFEMSTDNSKKLGYDIYVGAKDINETERISKKFVESLKTYCYLRKVGANNSKQPTAISSTQALKNLNDFIPKYNTVSYKAITLVGDTVAFRYGINNATYSHKIHKQDLKAATYVINQTNGDLIITCKDNKNKFYADYFKALKPNFTFSTNNNGDVKKLAELLNEFVAAL
jgi:hypothetical protein